MRVLITEPANYSADLFEKIGHDLTFELKNISTNEQLRRHLAEHEYEALFISLGLNVDRDLVGLQPTLKYIVTPTTGLTHISDDILASKQVEIISLKGEENFLSEITTTAEHAWLLMLALKRQLLFSVKSINEGNWQRNTHNIKQLNGKTAGIIGYGRLGKIVARYAQAFGMKVLINEIRPKKHEQEYEWGPLVDIFQRSDVIFLLANFEPNSPKIITKDVIKWSLNSPILINVSRGELVDEIAIINGVETGRLSGYGTDVLIGDSSWDVDAAIDNPVFERAKVDDRYVVTPHVAGYAKEAVSATRSFVFQKFISKFEKNNN